jgi:hypothetical protein
MNTYNFKTNKAGHIFDNIKYVVDSHNVLTCPVEEASVVNLFDRMFVAIPVKYLDNVVIGGLLSETTGYFLKGYDKMYFSIHEEILYLRKRC